MSTEESATARPPSPLIGALERSPTYVRLSRRVPPALLGQLLRFAIVGVTNTVLSWLLFALAIHLGVWYPAASVGAFVAGAVNSYTLNRLWTFRAGSSSASTFARYAVVQLIGLATNLAVLVALVEWLSLNRLLAQILALVCVSVLTFALNRQWAFAARPAPQAR